MYPTFQSVEQCQQNSISYLTQSTENDLSLLNSGVENCIASQTSKTNIESTSLETEKPELNASTELDMYGVISVEIVPNLITFETQIAALTQSTENDLSMLNSGGEDCVASEVSNTNIESTSLETEKPELNASTELDMYDVVSAETIVPNLITSETQIAALTQSTENDLSLLNCGVENCVASEVSNTNIESTLLETEKPELNASTELDMYDVVSAETIVPNLTTSETQIAALTQSTENDLSMLNFGGENCVASQTLKTNIASISLETEKSELISSTEMKLHNVELVEPNLISKSNIKSTTSYASSVENTAWVSYCDFDITASEKAIETVDLDFEESDCEIEFLPGVLESSMRGTHTSINDSGIALDNDLKVLDTDDDENHHQDYIDEPVGEKLKVTSQKESKNQSRKDDYKKPPRPCMFCHKPQTQLKRHILSKHKEQPLIIPLLKINAKDQDRQIAIIRKQGIRDFNTDMLKSEERKFMRERRNLQSEQDMPIMCSGCKGFFAKSFKARHQLNCPASGTNFMVPLVSVTSPLTFKEYTSDFKELLNTLQLDEIGNYIKTDKIILMIGMRSFNSIGRKRDKVTEGRKTVRSRMRLIARIYLSFRVLYDEQTDIKLSDPLGNAADLYRRETMLILGRTIDTLCEKPDSDLGPMSISGQKSGLKISILNLLKLTGQILIGHFLVECDDEWSKRIVEFLKVLKLFENEIFGTAYYDLNYRRNRTLRKPINLPKDDDVRLLIDECKSIMQSIDAYDHPADSFVNIRSATATALIIFCARRGGEPVRLQLYQWHEAINGEWVIKEDLPDDFNVDSMLITYQTGKGDNHLVPVIFPPETIQAMKYLTDESIRAEAGVHKDNTYIFASTQKSRSHASGWHSINDILKRLSLKGAINATKNRHRVASLLAKLQLSRKEQQLIFQHFGHSERMNEDVYQVPPGSLQLQTTGKHLLDINSGSTKNTKHFAQSATNDIECLKESMDCKGNNLWFVLRFLRDI